MLDSLWNYLLGTNTRLHSSPYMDRPLPYQRAHKREASGVFSGAINSPKVCLSRCEAGPELIVTEPCRRVFKNNGLLCTQDIDSVHG